MVRHDSERPETAHLITDAPVPGHWLQVLSTMQANPFTHLDWDDVRNEAAHILLVSPTAEVARTCFGQLLASDATSEPGNPDGFIDTMTAEELVPENVPAGTWIFLPHRQDGWTELETTSARVRSALVKENAGRSSAEKFTLVEYGINLWLWAEPPSSGGDPVCHAGELISWESAWALGGASATGSGGSGVGGAGSGSAGSGGSGSSARAQEASARPPIYFGLPTVLRERRWNG
ncbi:MAG: hypothetical protein L0J19_06655 [Brevibacterium sp.]|nr:hypothetical protein [Brevibacterium sp.]